MAPQYSSSTGSGRRGEQQTNNDGRDKTFASKRARYHIRCVSKQLSTRYDCETKIQGHLSSGSHVSVNLPALHSQPPPTSQRGFASLSSPYSPPSGSFDSATRSCALIVDAKMKSFRSQTNDRFSVNMEQSWAPSSLLVTRSHWLGL